MECIRLLLDLGKSFFFHASVQQVLGLALTNSQRVDEPAHSRRAHTARPWLLRSFNHFLGCLYRGWFGDYLCGADAESWVQVTGLGSGDGFRSDILVL